MEEAASEGVRVQASRRLGLQSHLGLVIVGCGLTPAASCWVDTELLQLQSNSMALPGPRGPPPALNFTLGFTVSHSPSSFPNPSSRMHHVCF